MLPSYAQAVPAQTPGLLPMGMQQIARTHQGYANAPGASQSEVSQQHYEPPYDGANVTLTNNRLLYIGLGVVLVGIIVLLAIAIADSSDELPATHASPTQPASPQDKPDPQGQPTKPEAAQPRGLNPEPVRPEAFRTEAARAAAPEPAAPAVDLISVHVLSTPQGADVVLDGKPLGQTPLTVKIPRATGIVPLTVHHARYGDSTTKVDLSNDIATEVTLAAAPEPPPRPSSGRDAPRERSNDRGNRPASHDSKAHAPASPGTAQCQPPDRINPFDTSCGGKACPVCDH
jgi:hypothetical protein